MKILEIVCMMHMFQRKNRRTEGGSRLPGLKEYLPGVLPPGKNERNRAERGLRAAFKTEKAGRRERCRA